MSNVPHELAEEFPEYKEKMHDLKMSDAHFKKLSEKYHELNREIHRAEAAGLNITDEHYEELKQERMGLKDKIYQILSS